MEQDAFKDCKVRIMPDVHVGKGCVIGFTGNLGDKVIPNIVGVDIGCGILCVELGNIDLNLEKFDNVINKYIPSGFEVYKERKERFSKLQELKCYRELKKIKRLERSIGTLGGGTNDYTQYTTFMNTTTGDYYFNTYNNNQILKANINSSNPTDIISLGKLKRQTVFEHM